MVTNTFNPPDRTCLVNSPQSISLKCQQVRYIPFTITAVVLDFLTSVHNGSYLSITCFTHTNELTYTFCQNNNSIFTVYALGWLRLAHGSWRGETLRYRGLMPNVAKVYVILACSDSPHNVLDSSEQCWKTG